MDSHFLSQLDVEQWIADWRQVLGSDDDGRTICAVDPERNDTIIGFASAGSSIDPDPCADLELYDLNTDVSCHGSGVANRLLESVLLSQAASLWVG